MKWEVQLAGDAGDLKKLGRALNKEDISVSEENDQFVLRSLHFETLETADAVRHKAQELVTALSGIVRLLLGSPRPIRIGTIRQIIGNGSRVFVVSGSATLKLRVGEPTVVIHRFGGSIEANRPMDPAPTWVNLALQHEVVARALRLRNADDLEWVDLYRLYEVIESDTPLTNMEAKGWITGRQVRRFKRTANSQKIVGDKARHGKDPYDPPKDPMTFSEARSMVDNLIKVWLRDKAGE